MAFHQLLFTLLLSLLSIQVTGQIVYKTPSGKKYHLANCRSVKNVSAELTVQKAKATGLEPCKICQPQCQPPLPVKEKVPKGEAATVQCKGITKAGSRCRHKTSIGNGYCFQHQLK